MPTRRNVLRGLGALLALHPTLSFAAAPTEKRLIVVLLRGGMDGLSALPAHGDPAYAAARGSAAVPAGEIVDLDGFFGLHPALEPLLPLWKARQFGAVHAVGTAGADRSHFDTQDRLENGTATQGVRTGWLNRAIGTLHGSQGPAVAIGRQVPLILRGEAEVSSVDPARDPRQLDAFIRSVEQMYGRDVDLADALAAGLRTQEMLAEANGDTKPSLRREKPDPTEMAETVGALLGSATGPRVAVLEIGGWDTHTRQQPVLERQFAQLAAGVLGIKKGLGPAWGDTAIVAVSEFGRTVKGNGTGGTDHGTGGVALLAGGAIRGGQVLGAWPGLSALEQGRDLVATTDTRSIFKGLLRDHLGLDPGHIDTIVFPDSGAAPALDALV